ncbi:MAG: 50S ribosomal protein L32 [Chloroflexota bacterium]
MPAVPKKKHSKARQGKRRQHLRVQIGHIVECPQCRSPRLAHHACPSCGTYRGRQAVAVEGPSLSE